MAWSDAARAAAYASRLAHKRGRIMVKYAKGHGLYMDAASRKAVAKHIRAMRRGHTPINEGVIHGAVHSTRTRNLLRRKR